MPIESYSLYKERLFCSKKYIQQFQNEHLLSSYHKHFTYVPSGLLITMQKSPHDAFFT